MYIVVPLARTSHNNFPLPLAIHSGNNIPYRLPFKWANVQCAINRQKALLVTRLPVTLPLPPNRILGVEGSRKISINIRISFIVYYVN